MQVAIAGGTGFVGDYLVDALLAHRHEPALLVRSGSESRVRRPEDCRIVPGDVGDDESVRRLVSGRDAVIYNVGILREQPGKGITFEKLQYEGAVRVIDAARAAGVRRFLLMSANGVSAESTAYARTKLRAERYAMDSGLAVTVFRPSVIFGDPRGKMEFATQLYTDMIKPPLPAADFFVAGGDNKGPVVMSPVHVADVAEAFAAALEREQAVGATYPLGGPSELAWGEIVRRIAEATGRTKTLVPVPIELMKVAATLLDWLPPFPVTRDQLTMLAEGNRVPPDALAGLTGLDPRAFSAEELRYLHGN